MTRQLQHPTAGLLRALLEGELHAEAQAHWAVHLEQCPACAGEAAALNRTDALLAATPVSEVPPGFAQRVLARTVLATPIRLERPQIINLPPAALGPLVLSVVGIAILLAILLTGGTMQIGQWPAATAYGGVVALLLALPLAGETLRTARRLVRR